MFCSRTQRSDAGEAPTDEVFVYFWRHLPCNCSDVIDDIVLLMSGADKVLKHVGMATEIYNVL